MPFTPCRLMVVGLFMLANTNCIANRQVKSAGNNGAQQPGSTSTVSGATLSTLIGGPTLDTNNFWPPVGQDCGVQLTASGTVPTTPPRAFAMECAGCHGDMGTGQGKYPNITGPRDFNTFQTIVRSGLTGAIGTMPYFKSTWLSDNDLTRIYAFITASAILETHQCSAVAPMSAADIASNCTAGLATWREPGTIADPNGIFTGAACVNCHGPDPLELAYLGYSDGDIMRRGSMHLEESDYASIVDMVHALRAKYNIGPRNPRTVRLFQPGGFVLDGNSAAARDAAFAAELQGMGLKMATSYINSVADANQAEAEMWAINRHALPIPIPFNHFTQDVIHNPPGYVADCNNDIDACADQGTISDWIPSSPHMPSNLSTAYQASDTYLANPNDTTFQSMVGSLPTQDTMPGTYPTGEIRYLDGGKYPAIYLASHCMRLEVMGLPGCFDKGVAPYPYQSGMWGVGTLANLWGTGYEGYPVCDSTWQGCGDPPANLPVWPTHLLQDMSSTSLLSDHFARLRHTWMTMWWTHFDPTLLVTGDPTAEQDEYFTRSIFWSADNDWDNHGQPVHNTYSVFNVYQILMHNIALLDAPNVASLYSCNKFPFHHPDLGAFPCTAVDIRSGYYPELTNFAEGKDFIHNNSNYQILYQPADGRKAAYERLAGNMYRLFFWKLIGQLQQSNWMCRPDIEQLRIGRAQTFLNQPEIQAVNGAADAAMFSQLQTLMSASTTTCPPFVP